jgi:lipopolysaccharide export system permease protein
LRKKLLKRSYRTIQVYLFKDFLFSFTVAFLFFFIIFFVNQILLLAERVLASHIPMGYVLKLILCTFPSIMALSFPFATLVGALMSLSNLSARREILAMESVGISMVGLSIPLLVVGIFFSLISFYINDYLLPLGAVQYRRISREIFTKMPSLELEPYSIKMIDNRIVITSDVNKNRFGSILIIENGTRNDRTIISAPEGEFENHPDRLGNFSINMYHVEQHSVDNRERTHQLYTVADKTSLNFLFSSLTGTAGISPQEMTSRDLLIDIRIKEEAFEREKANLSLTAEDSGLESIKEPRNRTLDQYKMEYYQKFAIPFSCLPFVLLAFSLGTFNRRSGGSAGFLVGIFLAFFYWAFLIMGRNLTMRSGFPPFLSIWAANIILTLLGLILYIRKIRS